MTDFIAIRASSLEAVVPHFRTSLAMHPDPSRRNNRCKIRFRQTLIDATPYHDQVAPVAVSRGVPIHFGDWLGVDLPVPQAAVTMLKPNVMLSRRYEDMKSGRRVTLLVSSVQGSSRYLGALPASLLPRTRVGARFGDTAGLERLMVFRSPRPVMFLRAGVQSEAVEFTIDNFMVLP